MFMIQGTLDEPGRLEELLEQLPPEVKEQVTDLKTIGYSPVESLLVVTLLSNLKMMAHIGMLSHQNAQEFASLLNHVVEATRAGMRTVMSTTVEEPGSNGQVN